MSPAPATPTDIHEATCSADGSGGVQRGRSLTRTEAIARRQIGGDVVVCGLNPFATAREARLIESSVGPCIPDGPHLNAAGALALPHFQQRLPPPKGHTFFETPIRKAVETT